MPITFQSILLDAASLSEALTEFRKMQRKLRHGGTANGNSNLGYCTLVSKPTPSVFPDAATATAWLADNLKESEASIVKFSDGADGGGFQILRYVAGGQCPE